MATTYISEERQYLGDALVFDLPDYSRTTADMDANHDTVFPGTLMYYADGSETTGLEVVTEAANIEFIVGISMSYRPEAPAEETAALGTEPVDGDVTIALSGPTIGGPATIVATWNLDKLLPVFEGDNLTALKARLAVLGILTVDNATPEVTQTV